MSLRKLLGVTEKDSHCDDSRERDAVAARLVLVEKRVEKLEKQVSVISRKDT